MLSSRRSASAPTSENLSGTLVYNPLGTSERTREDQLLQEAMQEDLAKRALARMKRDCTFKPQINHRPDGSQGRRSEASSTGGDVVERLLKKGEMAQKALEERLIAKQAQEEAARRSAFKPIVNPNDPYKAGLMHPPDLPVEERLLHYGKTVEESRRKLKEDREALEQKQLLEFFRPSTIARNSSDKKQKSFLTREETKKNDRDKEVGEARRQLMKEYTFQPSISKISEQLATKGRSSDPAQRAAALYAEALRRRQDREQKQREAAAMESDRSAYHPATNPTSVEWIAHGQHRNLFEADFVRRQEEYAKVHADHEKMLYDAVRSEAGGSSKAGRSSAGSPPMRVHHHQIEEQVARLYYESRDISAEAKKRLHERLAKEECPFKPKISVGTDAVMRCIQREKDPVRRLTMQTRRSFSADSRQRMEERQAAAVTAANESSGSMQRQVDPAEATEFYHRQLESLARKYEILHQKHAAAEMEKQLDCTFHPKTNVEEYRRKKEKLDQSVRSDSVSSVQGADSFVRRQQMGREKQRDREMRIQQLGKGMNCNGPNYTVIIPFQLSEGRAKPKIISRRGGPSPAAFPQHEHGLPYHYDPNDIAR
jgi:hypothetical protein